MQLQTDANQVTCTGRLLHDITLYLIKVNFLFTNLIVDVYTKLMYMYSV